MGANETKGGGCGVYRDDNLIAAGPREFCFKTAQADYVASKGRNTYEVRDDQDVTVLKLVATDPRPKVVGLEEPTGLSELGIRARKIAVEILTRHEMVNTGGCRAFYTPTEWEEHEERKVNGELVIVYDGGDVTCLCEGFLWESFQRELRKIGLHFEPWTNWYGVVYEE